MQCSTVSHVARHYVWLGTYTITPHTYICLQLIVFKFLFLSCFLLSMVSGQCSSTRVRRLRKGLELAGPSVAMEPAKMEMQQLLDFYLKGFLVSALESKEHVRNPIDLVCGCQWTERLPTGDMSSRPVICGYIMCFGAWLRIDRPSVDRVRTNENRISEVSPQSSRSRSRLIRRQCKWPSVWQPETLAAHDIGHRIVQYSMLDPYWAILSLQGQTGTVLCWLQSL